LALLHGVTDTDIRLREGELMSDLDLLPSSRLQGAVSDHPLAGVTVAISSGAAGSSVEVLIPPNREPYFENNIYGRGVA
jgi:hypothetical protein